MYTNFYGFINSDFVKKNTTICGQLEDDFITPYIILSQEKYIINILGSTLYNDLQNSVQLYINSGTAISTTYKNLIDNYIKTTVLHYCLFEMIPFMQTKLTNIGLVEKNSEFSSSSSAKNVDYLRNAVKSTADFYAQKLEKHLCEYNTTLYPYYSQAYTGDGVDPKDSLSDGFGMFLDF